MPKTRPPYAPEFRQQMVDLADAIEIFNRTTGFAQAFTAQRCQVCS